MITPRQVIVWHTIDKGTLSGTVDPESETGGKKSMSNILGEKYEHIAQIEEYALVFY